MQHKAGIATGVVVAVLAVIGGAAALDWYRDGLPASSRDDDACPAHRVTGGLVGLDAATGAERWTNVVPSNGQLDAADGEVHHTTMGHPDPVDRTLDADGSVVRCDPIAAADLAMDSPVPGVVDGREGYPDPDRLIPGATVDGLAIVPWGDGLRATDEQGVGVWGTTDMEARSLLGDDLLVQTRHEVAEARAAARIDLRTGEIRWEVPGLIVNAEGARHLVIVRDADPNLPTYRALDLATGDVRWRATLGGVADATIDPRAWEVGDLVVFATSDDGGLAALDAATGGLRWTTTVESPATSRRSPESSSVLDVAAGAGGTIVIAVDAFRPEDYVD